MKRNCDTCAHLDDDGYCLRSGYTWSTTRQENPNNACDLEFSGWEPEPPKPKRRSLLQWMEDTIWRMRSEPEPQPTTPARPQPDNHFI